MGTTSAGDFPRWSPQTTVDCPLTRDGIAAFSDRRVPVNRRRGEVCVSGDTETAIVHAIKFVECFASQIGPIMRCQPSKTIQQVLCCCLPPVRCELNLNRIFPGTSMKRLTLSCSCGDDWICAFLMPPAPRSQKSAMDANLSLPNRTGRLNRSFSNLPREYLDCLDFWSTLVAGRCPAAGPHMVGAPIRNTLPPQGVQILGISLEHHKSQRMQLGSGQSRISIWPTTSNGPVWDNKIWKAVGPDGIPLRYCSVPE